jgi:dihydrofolate synthase/folylpolyglutamate synthase
VEFGENVSSFDLGQGLLWLEDHINLEAMSHPGPHKVPTLERIREALNLMGNPEKTSPSLHVTGTNGKGSTVAMITDLLIAHGLKIGTYTSPDLESVSERIAVNAMPISDEDFAQLLWTLRGIENVMKRPPSRFEILTAAAFGHFADVGVDAKVIEVGLGGLWDATNVVNAEVSVVTNIEYDHTEILGDTRQQIAKEKAGIIWGNSTGIIGEKDSQLADIFIKRAKDVGCSQLLFYKKDFDITSIQIAFRGNIASFKTPFGKYDDIFISLHGKHQVSNALLALVAVESFFGRSIDVELLREVFSKLSVPGRLERIKSEPLVILDGAHNSAGARALGTAIKDEYNFKAPLTLIVGMLKGKDPVNFFRNLNLGSEIERIIVTRPPSVRSVEPDELARYAKEVFTNARIETSRDLSTITESLDENSVYLVTGSLYLVGAMRSLLKN